MTSSDEDAQLTGPDSLTDVVTERLGQLSLQLAATGQDTDEVQRHITDARQGQFRLSYSYELPSMTARQGTDTLHLRLDSAADLYNAGYAQGWEDPFDGPSEVGPPSRIAAFVQAWQDGKDARAHHDAEQA